MLATDRSSRINRQKLSTCPAEGSCCVFLFYVFFLFYPSNKNYGKSLAILLKKKTEHMQPTVLMTDVAKLRLSSVVGDIGLLVQIIEGAGMNSDLTIILF